MFSSTPKNAESNSPNNARNAESLSQFKPGRPAGRRVLSSGMTGLTLVCIKSVQPSVKAEFLCSQTIHGLYGEWHNGICFVEASNRINKSSLMMPPTERELVIDAPNNQRENIFGRSLRWSEGFGINLRIADVSRKSGTVFLSRKQHRPQVEFWENFLFSGYIANSSLLPRSFVKYVTLASNCQYRVWINFFRDRMANVGNLEPSRDHKPVRGTYQWADFGDLHIKPRPLTHLKLALSGIGGLLGGIGGFFCFNPDLVSVTGIDAENNEGKNTEQQSGTIKQYLQPWRFMAVALAGGFGVLWGMWTLSRERRKIIATMAFLGGLALWAYAWVGLLTWGLNQ